MESRVMAYKFASAGAWNASREFKVKLAASLKDWWAYAEGPISRTATRARRKRISRVAM
jgi:hypothetical protein